MLSTHTLSSLRARPQSTTPFTPGRSGVRPVLAACGAGAHSDRQSTRAQTRQRGSRMTKGRAGDLRQSSHTTTPQSTSQPQDTARELHLPLLFSYSTRPSTRPCDRQAHTLRMRQGDFSAPERRRPILSCSEAVPAWFAKQAEAAAAAAAAAAAGGAFVTPPHPRSTRYKTLLVRARNRSSAATT